MSIPPLRTLETQRVRLRVCQVEDTDAVFAAEEESLAELQSWFWWMHPEHNRKRCAAWAESRVASWLKGEEFSFLIIDKGFNKIVGCTWLNSLDTISLRASLGYWVRSGSAGQGFASEAAREITRWAFEELDLQRIEIVLGTQNVKSRRLAERIGAQFEGIARKRLRINQHNLDACVYSLLPGELK